MTRKEARTEVLKLLFETGFRADETPEEIYERAMVTRVIEENDYIHSTYFGVCGKLGFLDEKLSEYSRGWKAERISPVSLAVIRLAIYEMYFRDDVPDSAAVNEAVELVKTFDDEDKVRPFVNGVLNAVLQARKAEGNS